MSTYHIESTTTGGAFIVDEEGHSVAWVPPQSIELAPLFAAAPELLQACKDLAQELYAGRNPGALPSCYGVALAAIEKAEGRAK